MFKIFARVKDLFTDSEEQPDPEAMSKCTRCGCTSIKYATQFTNFEDILNGKKPKYKTTATCEFCGHTETVNINIFRISKEKGLEK